MGDYSSGKNRKRKKWNIISLGSSIPEPVSKKIDIHTNTEKELWIDVLNISEEDYYKYLIMCKEYGYIVEQKESSNEYDAYNEDGYHLRLDYYTNNKMTIQLDAPTKVTYLDWSSHAIAEFLPEPESDQGAFQYENQTSSVVVVSGISRESFTSYYNSCIECGFAIDSKTSNSVYSAFNSDGYSLSISYSSGNGEMEIKLTQPREKKKITWPTVGIGTLLPVPDSLLGNVSIDYEWAYSVYLANSTREDYEKYVEKCINSGFDKDVRNYGDSVWADYSEKISLNVSYEGCDTMYVSIRGSLNEDYSMYKRKSDSK
ncbi:MAG: DUF6591 domain-containing protein [Blautia sp.]|nr:DUF6591 domain-containing protein [Blautia sp.]